MCQTFLDDLEIFNLLASKLRIFLRFFSVNRSLFEIT